MLVLKIGIKATPHPGTDNVESLGSQEWAQQMWIKYKQTEKDQST